jgi:host factor-I protein
MAFKGPAAGSHAQKGKTPPPDDTRHEASYLKSLGESQTPVAIKLMSGEVFRGWVEYYDRRMVRLTRDGGPNLFIFKHEIAYIAEESAPKAKAAKSAASAGAPVRSK